MKNILGIIAFTVTFGLSAGLVGLLFGFPQSNVDTNQQSSSAYKYKIKSLLKRDIRNGQIRNHDIYRLDRSGEAANSTAYTKEYSEIIDNYYEASASMNDANLPEDFKYAWREHMEAWGNQANYVRSLQVLESEVDAKTYSDNTDEINRTWYQVLRIADRYGVDIDRSYYQ